jgi:hypothetical protein
MVLSSGVDEQLLMFSNTHVNEVSYLHCLEMQAVGTDGTVFLACVCSQQWRQKSSILLLRRLVSQE